MEVIILGFITFPLEYSGPELPTRAPDGPLVDEHPKGPNAPSKELPDPSDLKILPVAVNQPTKSPDVPDCGTQIDTKLDPLTSLVNCRELGSVLITGPKMGRATLGE